MSFSKRVGRAARGSGVRRGQLILILGLPTVLGKVRVFDMLPRGLVRFLVDRDTSKEAKELRVHIWV